MIQRTIKFKAKRLDNGEWVEGDLLHDGFVTSICFNDKNGMLITEEVDTSTVCQFTGLKDKDGKEIWEHDLMTGKPIGSGVLEVRYNRGCFKLMAMEGDTEYFELPHVPLDKKGNLIEFSMMCSKFDRKEGK